MSLDYFLQWFLAEGSSALLVVLVAFLLAAFWIYQFIHLMTFRDAEFPGKYDKALWVAGLLVGNLAGAAAFWLWKHLFRTPSPARRYAGETTVPPPSLGDAPRGDA